MSAQPDDTYDEKSRGPEYRRGFADGRLAERAASPKISAVGELRRQADYLAQQAERADEYDADVLRGVVKLLRLRAEHLEAGRP